MKERSYDIGDLLYGIVEPDFKWDFNKGDTTELNGSGHNATLYNGVTVVDDKCNIESAYEMDGVDDYIQIDDHADFDPGSDDFTVSIWVKKLSASVSGSNNIVVDKTDDGAVLGSNEWALFMSTTPTGVGPGGFAIESGTTPYYALGIAPVTINEWNHLVGMRDGDTIRFFKNGILEGSTYIGGVSVNNVGRDILIGKILSGQHANAIFDDFAYYQKALTQEQVKALYGAGCDFYTPQLAYRYGFNGMEKDNEVKGSGNSYTTLFRQYDPRIGRWLSIDPKANAFPWQSPYAAYNNNPIIFIDPGGDSSSIAMVIDKNLKTKAERKIERISKRFERRYNNFKRNIRGNRLTEQQSYEAFRGSSNRNLRLTQKYEDNVKSRSTWWTARSGSSTRIRGNGSGEGALSQNVNLSTNQGTLTINYNMKPNPDRLVITDLATGDVIFDSGLQSRRGTGANASGVTVPFNLSSGNNNNTIRIQINPGRSNNGSKFRFNLRFQPGRGSNMSVTPEDAETQN